MMPSRFSPSCHRRRSSGGGVDSGQSPLAGKVGPVVILEMEDVRTRSWTEVALLVQRAQEGDRDAFGRLVEQFQPTVRAIALRRLGNLSEALELTQEVFLHVLRRIHQLREPERFAGWLRQVAVRMAINRATRRLAPPTVETGVLEGAYEQGDQPVDELISRERAERLWEALGRLKTLDRDTLIAFYIRGLSLVEMAEELDVPLGTIKRRLHTARKRLKAELEASVADADEWTDGFALGSAEDEDECVGAGISAAGW
jgi:RNA polymerase sigma-70 factor (ECF subfamily)